MLKLTYINLLNKGVFMSNTKKTKDQLRQELIKSLVVNEFDYLVHKSDEMINALNLKLNDENGKKQSKSAKEMEEIETSIITEFMKSEDMTFTNCNNEYVDNEDVSIADIMEIAETLATARADSHIMFKDSVNQDKSDKSLVNQLTYSVLPVVEILMDKGSNQTWNMQKIGNRIYDFVDYNPIDKSEGFVKSASFEMRVTRISKRIAMSVEQYNPKSKSFNDANCYVIGTEELQAENPEQEIELGEVYLPSAVLVPRIPVPVANSSKKINMDNPDYDTLLPVSIRSVDDHYKNAYKGQRGTGNSDNDDLTNEQKIAQELTKWLDGKTELYQKFIDTKGKEGKSEAVLETVFDDMENLFNSLDDFVGTRENAEQLAEELEKAKLEKEQKEAA